MSILLTFGRPLMYVFLSFSKIWLFFVQTFWQHCLFITVLVSIFLQLSKQRRLQQQQQKNDVVTASAASQLQIDFPSVIWLQSQTKRRSEQETKSERFFHKLKILCSIFRCTELRGLQRKITGSWGRLSSLFFHLRQHRLNSQTMQRLTSSDRRHGALVVSAKALTLRWNSKGQIKSFEKTLVIWWVAIFLDTSVRVRITAFL